MALYCYLKKEPKIKKRLPVKQVKKLNNLAPDLWGLPNEKKLKKEILPNKEHKSAKVREKIKIAFPVVSIAVGLGMLFLVLYPVVKWQLTENKIAPKTSLLNPISNNNQFVFNSVQYNSEVQAKGSQKDEDLINVSNYFPGAHQRIAGDEKVKEYTISIPKLKIEDAKVAVGGEDLSQSLIHYGGTAFPGNYGNAVIFGHSTLPEFFNPKNYSTMFSTLPNLEVGDSIFTKIDGITYKYVVDDLITVDPSDISVLEQRYDNYYLSLITCVPPGLKWKRLVVKARLMPL